MLNLSKVLDLTMKLFFVLLGVTVIVLNLISMGNQQYVFLAESFLRGHLDFVSMPPHLTDMVLHNGYYYWPNPPFPAVLLMFPVIILKLLGVASIQGFVQIVIGALLVWVLGKVFITCSSKKDVTFWVYSFIFSTCFIGVFSLPSSWYFASTVSVFLTFLAYLLYKKGYSMAYVGIIYGLILLTRFTAALGIIFYIFLLLSENNFRFKFDRALTKKFILLLAPFFCALVIMISYNYARYGTWKELGYVQNFLFPWHQTARNYGIFSLKHVPGNIYYLFLNAPKPVLSDGVSKVLKFPFVEADPWGMSIFVTSPVFFLLFTLAYKKRESILLLLTSFLIMIPILLYFGVGWIQFGYRYSLDFLPYLFIALVSEYSLKNKELSLGVKLVILLSSLSNFYLLFTMLT
ncbi:TPA: hypothetical protein DDY47_00755 [candidate division WWE3 bacterium]|uniref:Glycosyltransferase RgtA/B/C/D-like domain-containing protein n=3 Tax=Katanobacteria TaxID=422282 RepID=A0A1F4W0S6_UNCKA|nr:MAG: hypothetical protein UU86_C0029G0006 [candidate division WWE3 bacterium GW2011_GWC1_42_102]KKS58843.1 MAG: hypothetical protein UV25_C0040G0004 [candidate division WWE3 bacterium GW2011_GWB1_42_41]KKS61241.1 MAG: hypothetical protein UV27_C0004G0064 [candidate division WWE3 bacterium GW2011_GWA1_42_46]KKS63532.1 MAG: hypothetical protein UV31_C0009G0006 [candidate division WWE3 bacterium GW2011_GWF1_42_51]OGC62878.1 MAG: hypothetical protein A2399_01730 [candidate division WWE3 bacteriu